MNGATMSGTTRPDREGMRRWVENWRRVGPILEAERWNRLCSMNLTDSQRMTGDLLSLWQPHWSGDQGEELLLHQRVFLRGRRTR
jgi:hypothetical protein